VGTTEELLSVKGVTESSKVEEIVSVGRGRDIAETSESKSRPKGEAIGETACATSRVTSKSAFKEVEGEESFFLSKRIWGLGDIKAKFIEINGLKRQKKQRKCQKPSS